MKIQIALAAAVIASMPITGAFAQQNQDQNQQAGQQSAESRGLYDSELVVATDRVLRLGSNVEIGLAAGYWHLLKEEWGVQVGYTTDFSLVETVSTVTIWQNIFGIRYNFNLNRTINDQLFADVGVGFSVRNGGDSTDIHLIGEWALGKRFAISEKVSYSPRVALTAVGGEGLSVSLTLLALSIFF